MTTITSNISWSGSWSRLLADPTAYDTPTTSSDAESSSISTLAASDDGDTVVLSQEAQQAVNLDAADGTSGLDAVSAIYTAAATVINSAASSDKEKIAAFGAAYTLSSLSNTQTIGPAQYDVSSYGYKFEMLEGKFFDDIKNSSLMNTFLNTPMYNIPGNASDYQKALSDILYDANAGVAYGVNSLSINLQETTTQAADGSTTTSYSFSYQQGAEAQAGTQEFGGLYDPMSAFSGGKTPTPTKPHVVGGDTGWFMDTSTEDKKKSPITFENARAKLDQEIVDELFGSSDSKGKITSSDSNDQTQKKNDTNSINGINDGASLSDILNQSSTVQV